LGTVKTRVRGTDRKGGSHYERKYALKKRDLSAGSKTLHLDRRQRERNTKKGNKKKNGRAGRVIGKGGQHSAGVLTDHLKRKTHWGGVHE